MVISTKIFSGRGVDADVTVVKSGTLLMIKENRVLFLPACQEVAFT